MRNRLPAIRSQILTLLVLLSLASPAAAAAPGNAYDKYRKNNYSNKGLMNEQDEMSLGAQVHQQVLQKYRLVQDPEINAYVQTLGERLARASKRPDIAYRFYVIDDRSVNAFALPGGFVYVNMGLIDIAQSEEELAAAVAHEVAHVVARHGLQNVKKAQRTALLFGILGIGAEIATGGSGAGQAARAASELFAAGVITKYSRDFEREADYLGLYNMAAVGYEPQGMVRIFQRLEQNASRAQGSSNIGGIFASHPNAAERVRNTEAEIRQHLGGGATTARSADGSTRPRRAGSGQPAGYAPRAGNGAEFARLKQAVASYRGGGGYGNNYPARYPSRRNDPRNSPRQNDPYYDPNDPANVPAQNDRPVLRRQP